MNTFGHILRLTTFGESHGPAMGGVIDGLPPRFRIDFDAVDRDLARRRPGKNRLTTARREPDTPRWLSGLAPDGSTLGSPVAFIIENSDARPQDYDAFARGFRPNHADFTFRARYGTGPLSGGGRTSARETVNWVAAGAIARQLLASKGISVTAWLSQAGHEHFEADNTPRHEAIDASAVYCPDPEASARMEREIDAARLEGDTVGGRVSCHIEGLPAGIGEPVFGKLHARLAEAMMTINAAKGFEYGLGFAAAEARGSQTADSFSPDPADPRGLHIEGNSSGGIQGGISNGQLIYFNVAFKPAPTLMRDVESVDASGKSVLLAASGRHDPCVAIRAVPVVEAMACLTIADAMMEAGISFTPRQ